MDVFYVTDLTGTKITHAGRQATDPAGPLLECSRPTESVSRSQRRSA